MRERKSERDSGCSDNGIECIFSWSDSENTTRGVNGKLVITLEASAESMNSLLRLQSVLLRAVAVKMSLWN